MTESRRPESQSQYQPRKTSPSVNEGGRQTVPKTIIEAIKPLSADELDRAGFNLETLKQNRT